MSTTSEGISEKIFSGDLTDFREKLASRRDGLDLSSAAEKLIREREESLKKAKVTNVPLGERPMPGTKRIKKPDEAPEKTDEKPDADEKKDEHSTGE